MIFKISRYPVASTEYVFLFSYQSRGHEQWNYFSLPQGQAGFPEKAQSALTIWGHSTILKISLLYKPIFGADLPVSAPCFDKELQEMRKNAAHRLVYRETVGSGLADMMIASFFIVPGILIDRPRLAWLYLLPLLALGPVYRSLKRRWVEPRIGHAGLKGEPPGRLLGGIALFTVAAVALLGLLLLLLGDAGDPGQWRRWSPALAGLLFGAGLFHAARRSGLLRYHLLAMVSLAGGALLAVSVSAPSYLGLRIYLLAMGVLVFVNGLALFTSFTRRHPLPEVDDEQ